jgi:hypothetical protein
MTDGYLEELTPMQMSAMLTWWRATGSPVPERLPRRPCNGHPWRRAAMLVEMLVSNGRITHREAAESIGLTPDGTYRALLRLSVCLPIYRVAPGTWTILQ